MLPVFGAHGIDASLVGTNKEPMWSAAAIKYTNIMES